MKTKCDITDCNNNLSLFSDKYCDEHAQQLLSSNAMPDKERKKILEKISEVANLKETV